MSELTIRIPDPVSGKLKAYLAEHAEHGDDPAAFVAAVIEEKLDKLVSGNGAVFRVG